jgi:hypothetical protein
VQRLLAREECVQAIHQRFRARLSHAQMLGRADDTGCLGVVLD